MKRPLSSLIPEPEDLTFKLLEVEIQKIQKGKISTMKINSIEKGSMTYYSFDEICNYCNVNHDVREWSKIKNKDFSYTDEDKKRYISKKGIYQFLLF